MCKGARYANGNFSEKESVFMCVSRAKFFDHARRFYKSKFTYVFRQIKFDL